MPKFAYVAAGPDGAEIRGIQQADTVTQARQLLAQRQLRTSELVPKRTWTDLEVTQARLKGTDLMHLSRQLSAFLRAGIPILDALAVISDESDRPAVRRVVDAIIEDLRAGERLSDAIDRHPRDFPEWYRGILRSAELTGRLDEVLDQLSSYIERDVEARRKIQQAMIYPAIVFVMALVTVLVLSIYVLPKFEDFFTSLDADLPLPTRMLLGSTRFLAGWWWLISAVIGGLGAAAVLATRVRRGRYAWHRLLIALPIIGPAIRYAKIERFTRLMSSMVDAGVPLPAAMSVATGSLGNLVYQDALGRARVAMMQGSGLAQPIAATGLFPGIASQMIRVGEDTGTLDSQLQVAASFYERELDYKIKKVATAIEPAVILVMGGIVGFVAVALVSAMYGIFRTANLG